MGNKSNTTIPSKDSSISNTPYPVEKTMTTIPTTSSIAPTTIITPSISTITNPMTTVSTTIANNATTTATTTSAAAPTTARAAAAFATLTTTTVATATTPTPTITSTTSTAKTIPTTTTTTTPVSTGSNGKPSFFSVAVAATAEANKTKSPASSAYARWYRWSKFEQHKRDKDKILWYMGPPVTTTDMPSMTTPTLTMTTARIGNNPRETSDTSNIIAAPSYQLRSTAVYSPPHGDRILSGRNELIETDTTNFKFYVPDTRAKQTGGAHAKATMFKMNTRLKQTPLPTPSSTLTSSISDDITYTSGDTSSLPTFVSRGLQTDLETQPTNSPTSHIRYYEKQQSQVVPISAFGNNKSNNDGFFHLSTDNNQPVLPPIEKTPVWINDQPQPPLAQPTPTYPTSILKKPSTGLSQDAYNPLSEQTHDKVLEELRKRNKNAKDGIYRVKKVHLLEKSDLNENPSTVSFNLPPPQPPTYSSSPRTKASQSIFRSEKLFSN